MVAQLARSFSTLLACLLALAALIAPAAHGLAQAAPGGQATAQASDLGAARPAVIDALAYFRQKVIATGEAGSYFGLAVALSADGNTALVGAPIEDVGANANQGAAYLFTRSGGLWTLQQKLVAADGAGADEFGHAVALSGDTALVSAHLDDGGQGSVYVYVRSGAVWSQQQKLTATGAAADDMFGGSVALSGDTALVGVWQDDATYANQGAAYVFTRSGATWTQQAYLTAADGAESDGFGYSVALEGDTALLSAPFDDWGSDQGQGSAYVFTRSGTTWTQRAQLTASDAAEADRFGEEVALSGDTALVGAIYDDVGANDAQGSVYVFTGSGAAWTEQAHLTADDSAAGDHFGGAVALVGDTALIGAPTDDAGAQENQGSVYIFTRSGATWTQRAHLAAADGVGGDFYGISVALAGDTALVGAMYDDVGANASQGSAYVLTGSGTAWAQQAHLTSSDGAAGDNFGIAVAVKGDTALVGAPNDDIGANADQGSAYVFVRGAAGWELQQKLTADDGAATDLFGYAVALSGDGNKALVGAYSADGVGNANQGAAYVFVRSGATWTQQAKLTAMDGDDGDAFGISVALTADGNTALVGAFLSDPGAVNDQGAAYVFTSGGLYWSLQQKLFAADGAAGDNLGRSVAISGDLALVGAPRDQVGANTLQGSAYVFSRSGTTWTEQEKLTASDGAAQDWFGFSVAIYGDTALVGAYNDDVGPNDDQGSAYVFTRVTADTWAQQAQLTASDGEDDDFFGRSVALGNGVALVGAYDDSVGANPDQGSAYYFVGSDAAWTEQAQLIAPDGAASDLFGVAVALSGRTLLVGAHEDDIGANANQGSAYFFSLPYTIHLPLVLRTGS